MTKIFKQEEIILLFTWGAVVCALFVYQQSNLIPFSDTDDYMRLVYVLEYLNGKLGWYDHVIDRSNVPFGGDIHWTHLYDIILIAGTYIFRIFFNSVKDALLHWAMFVTPVISCFSIVIFYRICRNFFKKEMSFICGMLFMLTPYICVQMRTCRPDHHGFLILLSLLTIKYFLDFLKSVRSDVYIIQAIKLGLAYSLALTASPELLLVIVPLELFFIIHWIIFQKFTKAFMVKSISWLVQIVICYLAFSSDGIDGISHIDYDKLSIVHVYLAFTSSIFWFVLYKRALLTKYIDCCNMQKRLTIVALIGVPLILSILLLFPKIIYLMSGNIDSEVRRLWLPNINEMKSPLNNQSSYVFWSYIFFILITIIGYVFSLLNLRHIKKPNKLLITFMCSSSILYIIFGAISARTLYYTAIFAIPFITNGLYCFFSSKLDRNRGYYTILVFIFSIYVIPLSLAHDNDDEYDTRAVSKGLVDYFQKIKEPSVILTTDWYGPMLLFYTNHSVVSIPYHRQTYGILADDTVFSSRSATLDDLKKILKKSQVSYLVFARSRKCSSGIYKALFHKQAPKYLEMQKANVRNVIIYKVIPKYL